MIFSAEVTIICDYCMSIEDADFKMNNRLYEKTLDLLFLQHASDI